MNEPIDGPEVPGYPGWNNHPPHVKIDNEIAPIHTVISPETAREIGKVKIVQYQELKAQIAIRDKAMRIIGKYSSVTGGLSWNQGITLMNIIIAEEN